jgi:predicted RNase H-like nuclease
VLGIDPGWSATKATTGLCLLEWADGQVLWGFDRARADKRERQTKLERLVGGRALLAVGVDGPLTRHLKIVSEYRAAEALLSRGELGRQCRPGPTNGGSGPCLHMHATELAKLAVRTQDVGPATWRHNIHDKALVEAFPNAFLAVLCAERSLRGQPEKKRRRTDTLFPRVSRQPKSLLDTLLPEHKPICDLKRICHHEDIAAFVCALTALCAAEGRCVAVGDKRNGYILLPPLELWAASAIGHPGWAESSLCANWENREDKFKEAQLWSNDRLWLPRS